MPTDTKTRNSMENIALDRVISGDSFSANQVDPDPMCLVRFGNDFNEPPALPCSRDGALVGNGAVTPKSCLSPLEMRTLTATGGLLPAGTAPIATRTTFD